MSALPMSGEHDGNVSPKELWGLAWKVAAVSFLVLGFGGLALRGYAVLRFSDSAMKVPKLLKGDWLESLLIFAVCGAVTFASVVVAWRLMHPKRSAPGWSLGVIVLGILLFTILVWPTVWTYREYGCQILRINRLTGTPTDIATLPGCAPKETRDTHGSSGS